MQKKTKIIVLALILVLSVISISLVFVLRSIYSDAKEGSLAINEKKENKNEKIEVLFDGLESFTQIDFSLHGRTDFEWMYESAEGSGSFNVVGIGMSAERAVDPLASVRAFFEESGYVLDSENMMSASISGLYGYYKDDMACLISGVNSDFDPSEPDKVLRGDKFDLEIQCGQISGQDLARLSLSAENVEREREEHEAKTIFRAYLSSLSEYSDNKGGNIEFIRLKKIECPGCWETEVSFEIRPGASSSEPVVISGNVYLQDWVVEKSDLQIPPELGLTPYKCVSLGGFVTEPYGQYECPSGNEIIGEIASSEGVSFCCRGI